MGIDYGTKRIGVAISDPSCTMAHPLETIQVRDDGSLMQNLKSLIKDYSVDKIVVGLPYNMDGTEGISAGRVTEWAKGLEQITGLPVTFWDERLTTSEAHEILKELSVKGPKKKKIIDKLAASLILKSYLEAGRP